MLTANAAIPIGTVKPFSNQPAVANFFGATSAEAQLAQNYFSGYDNSTLKPGNLLFSQYPTSAVAGYLRGGSVAALTLTQIQGLTGTLTVTVDGTTATSSTINLSAATSYSNAATIIQAGFTSPNFNVGYDSQRAAFTFTSKSAGAGAVVTGSIATTTLTVSAVTSGTLRVGQTISGTGITAGTTITALGTGTGGVGTYTVSASQTVSSTTVSAAPSSVSYATGTLSASLNLTSATAAVLSAGAEAATPAGAMNAITAITQNWAAFMTVFEPVLADKVSFDVWTAGTNNRYAYIAWDTDPNAIVANNTTSFGAQVIANSYSGSVPIGGNAAVATAAGSTLAAMLPPIAAFALGSIASIDFTRTNGRITFAFKSQSGLAPVVTDQTTAATLIANGYNFYGQYATANQGFAFFYNGSVGGKFSWLDEYINEIWMTNQLQLAMLNLLANVPSIPYNSAGYAMVAAACNDPIAQAVNFGAIRAGVSLSASQIAQVNNLAGVAVDSILSTRGWYLQIKDPGAQVRGMRQSPSMTLLYMDGGAVQQLNLASVVVQ